MAVVVYGLSRDFAHPAGTFRTAFERHAPDVFLHTWEPLGTALLSGSNASPRLDAMRPEEATLREAFNATRVVVDPLTDDVIGQPTFPYPKDVELAKRVLSRYASVDRAFGLMRRHGKLYDAVVLTRPDVVYREPFPIEPVTSGVVRVPFTRNATSGKNIVGKMRRENPGAECDFTHDFIAYGAPATVEAYANFGRVYLDVCARYPLPSNPYFPDRALAIHLKKDLGLTLEEFPLKHGLQRDGFIQEYV